MLLNKLHDLKEPSTPNLLSRDAIVRQSLQSVVFKLSTGGGVSKGIAHL